MFLANTKENSYQNENCDALSNVIVPAGHHVVQPVIYRSTSLPSAISINSSNNGVTIAPWDDPNQKYDKIFNFLS